MSDVPMPVVPPLGEKGPDGVEKHTTADMTKIQYPGKLNIASERGVHGYFSGCAAKLFDEADGKTLDVQINEWAAANPFFNIVDIRLATHQCMIFYTRAVTDEDIQDYLEVQQEVAMALKNKKEAREKIKKEYEVKTKEAEAKLKQRADDEYKELKRLAELGKKHLANCAGAKKEKKP